MRTFIENYLHFMKNCIRPHYEKLKSLKSGFIENSIFENNRDPCGVVHSLGGPKLAKLLYSVSNRFVTTAPETSKTYKYGENPHAKELCPLGSAVVTPTAGIGQLPSTGFQFIAHTAPPIFPATETNLVHEWKTLMANCYMSSLVALRDNCKVSSATPRLAVASPILGSGAR